MLKNILFVCTGNTCRSPMAEGIFRQMAKDAGLEVEIRSAGVAAVDGSKISANAEQILREKGFTDPMEAKLLTGEMIDWADLVLTMTMQHKQYVIERHPHAADKVYTLKEYVIDDEAILHRIQEREKLIAELQVKQALSQPITEEERNRALELDMAMPDFNIADPFGGSLEDYRASAAEIEQNLQSLLAKLKKS